MKNFIKVHTKQKKCAILYMLNCKRGSFFVFGYVKPVIPELLVKEHEFYRATYCGICRSMKKHTGFFSNATLTYDSVFLALVRMAYIDDASISAKMGRCFLHPLKKRCHLVDNEAIEYTAYAFAILSYYKLKDDLDDEGFFKRCAANTARPVVAHAKKRAKRPELAELVRDKLAGIRKLEDERCMSIDTPAELFGELLGEIFSYGLDGSDRLVTYKCGFHLGKFIYCADAAEDYEKDKKSGNYNPYVLSYGGADLTWENKETIKCALLLECRELEGAVNLIPFNKKITAENIVRNVIYLGLVKRIEFLDKENT